MWIETLSIRRWLTGVVLCIGAGSLTYHLARWYGTDDPMSLAIMVILAELFLGACVFLGLLITTRMSETLLLDPVHETTPSPAPAVWAPRAASEPSPADRRLQLYLKRVLHECSPADARPSAERRRAMRSSPLSNQP
ncbi:MAG: hypothetical protein KF774_10045 [Planctomyces sp.]|nr:hypothetical protein [Planctomyces sp.]